MRTCACGFLSVQVPLSAVCAHCSCCPLQAEALVTDDGADSASGGARAAHAARHRGLKTGALDLHTGGDHGAPLTRPPALDIGLPLQVKAGTAAEGADGAEMPLVHGV